MADAITAAPDWDCLTKLYKDLATIEKTRPGSSAAEDLEAAISLVLEGRVGTRDPHHRPYDAVRRARFVRRRRAATLSRRSMAGVPAITPDSDAQLLGLGFNGFRSRPEEIVCAHDSVRRLQQISAGRVRSDHIGVVLSRLVEHHSLAEIADELGVSTRTINRCLTEIRSQAACLLAA